MSDITLEQAVAQRDLWLAALAALATAQEYTIQDGANIRKLRRADLPEARKTLAYWEQRVAALDPARRRRIRFGEFRS